jgi:uracil-DNA glycosylase
MPDTSTTPDRIKLEPGWKAALGDEFAAPYMADLRAFLLAERQAGKRIFPPAALWFNALDLTPLDRVRVVILGQDPYHGAGQAHGLCFSVLPGTRPPPSLANITKELTADLGRPVAPLGDLTAWANQGVLLLNSVLTVEEGRAAAHQGKGWERFTDAIIRTLAEGRRPGGERPIAFILWGAYAQKKAAFVDPAKHLVVKSAHPSPLSAHNGFFGSKPFSQVNDWLRARGEPEIVWG